MENQNMILIAFVVIFLVILFVIMCKKNKKNTRETYIRSVLGSNCNRGLQRTPVDYAFKHPHGWQRNPHWKADPGNEHQPLDYGPIDFFKDSRRLNENNGVLFQQYRNDWKGAGIPGSTLVNDSKTRSNLMDIGDYSANRELSNASNPRFGPGNFINTEARYLEPNPFYTSLYWPKRDLMSKIGNY